jgi:hypothetical protein
MPKFWRIATIVSILLVAIIVVLAVRKRGSSDMAESLPLPNPVPIDLGTFYDVEQSTFNAPGCWQAVPRGLQTLGNVPFQIDGLIQLWGRGPAGMGRNYRERVDNLPVSGKFETLYVLHGASFATEDGTPIAEVVIRYKDGSSATNQIEFGTHVRDWWQPRKEQHPTANEEHSKVVWRSNFPGLPSWAKSLRLFGTALPNPQPRKEVASVDLVSTKSQVTWVVLAITTGSAGLLKADPMLDYDQMEQTTSGER